MDIEKGIELATTVSKTSGQIAESAAKIIEIGRSKGISRRTQTKLTREAKTYSDFAVMFRELCEANPGFEFSIKIGNLHMKNMLNVKQFAEQELGQVLVDMPNEIDEDWLLSFLNVACNTLNEEKQKILGKVLAGEIRKPNNVSVRTLGIIRDLTVEEYNLFKKLSNYLVTPFGEPFILKEGGDFTSNEFYSYSDLLKLSDARLVDVNPLNQRILSCLSGKVIYKINKKVIRLDNITDTFQEIKIPIYLLTKAGNELLNVFGFKPSDEHHKLVANKLKAMNANVKVSLHTFIASVDNNQIKYTEADELA